VAAIASQPKGLQSLLHFNYQEKCIMATYTGTAGNDSLSNFGGVGSDLFLGLGGDDTITGYHDKDTLDGGDGNDFLKFFARLSLPSRAVIDPVLGTVITPSRSSTADAATLFGGDGNDTLEGGEGNDSLVGGAGDDILIVPSYYGGSGQVRSSPETDTLEGGDGNDYFNLDMWVGRSINVVDGGAGYDVVKGISIFPTIDDRGTLSTTPIAIDLDNVAATSLPFANIRNIEAIAGIRTTGGNDNISASGSRSHNISTEGGDDTVSGGSGSDSILTGNGRDLVSGGDGRDQIYGGTGADTLSGEGGNDNLHGEGGDDIVNGGAGDDNLYGDNVYTLYSDGLNPYNNNNRDVDNGDDTLNGGDGSENIYGSLGNDLLNGDNDVDNLEGGSGDDRLRGGKGNDILSGEGNNSIFTPVASVAGADTFIFDSLTGLSFADLGTDRITDFQTGIDKIYLDQTIFTGLPTVLGETFQVVASPDLAATSTGLIVYSQGHLFYNANGAAAGYGTGGEFATFDNPALALSASDFIVGGLYPAN
jgi:Ca2+-binding RTX toxin-like protein